MKSQFLNRKELAKKGIIVKYGIPFVDNKVKVMIGKIEITFIAYVHKLSKKPVIMFYAKEHNWKKELK